MNRTGMLQGKVKPLRPANTSFNLIPANAFSRFMADLRVNIANEQTRFYGKLKFCRTCFHLSQTERLQRQLQLQRSVFRELLHSVRLGQKD